MKKISLLSILMLLITVSSFAQTNWPTDPAQKAEAMKHRVLYVDYLKAKDYKNAVTNVSVLLKKYPKLEEAIYQNGFMAYQEFAEKQTDAKLKMAYRDTALMLLDKRIELYQPNKETENEIFNTKGYYMFDYYSDDTKKYKQMYDFYITLINKVGNDTYYYNADYAMTMNSFMFKQKKIGFEEGVNNYQKINAIVQHNLANNEQEKQEWEQVNQSVTNMFAKDFKAALTCEFIEKNLAKKYKETKSEAEADKLLKYLEDAKCTKSPLYLEVLEKTSSGEPTYGKMVRLAKLNTARGNHAKARNYYNQALGLATTGKQKANIYGIQLNWSLKGGSKAQSKALAIKMMQADPSRSSVAWTTIGNLYMNSSGDCPSESKVKSKAYAIAAYNAYKKAGNSAKMALAKRYFPSSQDTFFEELKGKSYTLPCWIGETVVFP